MTESSSSNIDDVNDAGEWSNFIDSIVLEIENDEKSE